MISEDEKSMLIVGEQVRNVYYGRSDLTAVDNNGEIVLIEIKRDRRDIEGRKESFEFQAIRYAASYATIGTLEELLTKIYAPYIKKYRKEFENAALTSSELGRRELNEFLEDSGAGKRFNNKQRIILVASDFDELPFIKKAAKLFRKLDRSTWRSWSEIIFKINCTKVKIVPAPSTETLTDLGTGTYFYS